MMKILCLIGDPIKQSKSPAMHNVALRALGLDYRYAAFRVKEGELKNAIKGIRALGIAGANVTIPHKVDVMRHLDRIDPLAQKISAVNTIVNKNGKLIGYNTDGNGALAALKEKINPKGKKVVIIGAGGAARAVALTLASDGKIAKLVILNRTAKKARKLAKEIKRKTGCVTSGEKLTSNVLKRELATAHMLINCTSVGMSPKVNKSPVPKKALHKRLVVFDIVYEPIKTKLLKEAEEVGCKTVTGASMLVEQGARSFELFTGKKPDIDLMMQAVLGRATNRAKRGSIALIGFMGTGKNRVGKLLAKKKGMEFVDMDAVIERMAGKPIPAIFKENGEAAFRELEIGAAKFLSVKENTVIACGGGIVLNKINIDRLRENATIVLLTASPEMIFERVKKESRRPLLNTKKRLDDIKRLLAFRKPFYARSADITIDTSNRSPEEVIKEIIKRMGL